MNIGGRVFLGNDILPALSAHFREFYSKPLRFRATLPDFHLSPLSLACAISLERPFLHQEIKNAVWALSSGKVPGMDGFPVEFFRTFWEVCSADVFAFCDEFASNSVFLKEFNRATCVLVPKRLNPTNVTHFRPISILGTPYKIIAKLLSLRLAPVMPSIINPFQVAFVKGRRLQDAVVLANKVVHSLYCLRLPSFILKLDISKAFDSVSWEFLSDLLTRLAFGPSFRQWIMSLVTGAQLAVSFNGKCGDFFSLERGLRQGCPLSPLLFNLVAESFSVLFHHAAIVRTWLILRVFVLISGLSINSAKCHLSIIHADLATVLLTEACFGCKATSLPMDYLGLQITLSPPAPSFWNGVEQKLTDCLQCWQGKLLSLPGRFTLAKHCLASVPLHALVVFRPPVAVLRSVLAYAWSSLVSSLPNPPSIRLLFLFCPSPHLNASWGHVWRPWLISAWWCIWEERNNRVFRDTFSSPDSVARIVQVDVQFAIRLKRRRPSAASDDMQKIEAGMVLLVVKIYGRFSKSLNVVILLGMGNMNPTGLWTTMIVIIMVIIMVSSGHKGHCCKASDREQEQWKETTHGDSGRGGLWS
ncbi:Transposon TX1 uncharacterized protein [Nymphaea thermarum]|nr:Transposon TX1 uncharacterized protein [Nymphaea thermarum]